jgi:AcrR family transcriptional regulator
MMAREKTDRRSLRTRRLLTNALIELMLEKRFDAISVQDILDRADIGRSTFYGHFSSKEALLYSSLGEMLQTLELHMAQDGGAKKDGVRPALLPSLGLFLHVKQHQRLYRALFSSNGLEPITSNLQQQLAQIVEHNLSALLPELSAGRQPTVPLPILADFVAGAFLTLLRKWIEGNDIYTPEQIDAMFQRMVLPGVKVALEGGG